MTAAAASSSQQPLPSTPPAPSAAFLTRRAHLVSEIGDSLETVLTQINALNRGLEGIIEIGNEFASVEALWSQFESVMGNQGQGEGQGQGQSSSQGQEAAYDDREEGGEEGHERGEQEKR